MRIELYKPNKIFRKMFWVTISIVLFSGLISSVFADLSVGVKKGDWTEYSITYTGSPGQGHDISWARMEITEVKGPIVSVSITSRHPNGSKEIFNSSLNLQTGKLIDDFIIPSNLNSGDSFLDQNIGNITISDVGEHVYSGATRTVLYASTNQNSYVWDKVTGVNVESTSEQPDYSMHTVVIDTNLWQPSVDLNLYVFVLIALGVVIALVVARIFVLKYRKKNLGNSPDSAYRICLLINA
jgi:hypothetical protein